MGVLVTTLSLACVYSMLLMVLLGLLMNLSSIEIGHWGVVIWIVSFLILIYPASIIAKKTEQMKE